MPVELFGTGNNVRDGVVLRLFNVYAGVAEHFSIGRNVIRIRLLAVGHHRDFSSEMLFVETKCLLPVTEPIFSERGGHPQNPKPPHRSRSCR